MINQQSIINTFFEKSRIQKNSIIKIYVYSTVVSHIGQRLC